MNRDMNACIYIIHLSKSWINYKIRPENFCRTSDPDFSFEEAKLDLSVVFNIG